MNASEAKAALERANENVFQKQHEWFLAKVDAERLSKAYQAVLGGQPAPDAKTRQRACGEWYEAERKAENAEIAVKQAVKEGVQAAEACERALSQEVRV